MDTEQMVADHYGRPGLADAILGALAKSGKDLDRLVPRDFSGADEFHFGWRPATIAFAKALGFQRGQSVLDVGAGVGGPARHFAEEHGIRVTGIDLSADYVEAANILTQRCGLAALVSFQAASALAMPFEAETFDGAYTIHAAMNIADKARLFAETRRVLKPGAPFGVYDIMQVADGALPYPMPWAATKETSFVETSATYRALLQAAGFAIVSETDRGDMTRALVLQMREKTAKEGPPLLSLHTLMGPATSERLGNAIKTVEARIVSPIEIIAKVP